MERPSPLFPLRQGQLLIEQDHLQDPVDASGSVQLSYALSNILFSCALHSSASHSPAAWAYSMHKGRRILSGNGAWGGPAWTAKGAYWNCPMANSS